MPDPVSSYQNTSSNSVVECEPVPVGPEAATESASDFDCFEAEPGVRSLVEKQTRTELRSTESVPAEIPYVEIGKHCLSKVMGLAAAVESFSLLGVVKSGLEIMECVEGQINEAQDQANRDRASEACTDEGGIPLMGPDFQVDCLGPGMFK
jgi:hypothetical protein